MTNQIRIFIAIVTFACTHAFAAPNWKYAVTDVTVQELGSLGGAGSKAYDINDSGYVVGWATKANGQRHGFYYIPHSNYLYDLGGHPALANSEARSINNGREIVGFAIDSQGKSRGFIWVEGWLRMLQDASPFGPVNSRAVAIADGGLIAGERSFADGYGEATLWTIDLNFHPIYVPPYPWRGWANDINASGQIVGREKYSEIAHRWQWDGTGFTDVWIPGISGLLDGDALGINAAGAVTGYDYACCDAGGRWTQHAFFWNGVSAQVSDLGVFPLGSMSIGEDINNERFIAGWGDTVPNYAPAPPVRVNAAFLHHPNFGKVMLPSFLRGARTCNALALNERKRTTGVIQVVGFCEDAEGHPRAVRWDVTVEVVPLGSPFSF